MNSQHQTMHTAAFVLFLSSSILAASSTRPGSEHRTRQPMPCEVKAWVRAEDLRPSSISHGELKVKVIQPCTDVVTSVALRLRLDELAESSTLVNTTGTADSDMWDWTNETPSPDWSVTRNKRTAFKSETVLSSDTTLQTENWEQGVVFPFTVASPNVNYPAAVFPLMFQGRNSEIQKSSYGRIYRYIAIVQIQSTELRQIRTVDIPAGFTSFIPIETTVPSTKPHHVTVTAAETTEFDRCKDGLDGSERSLNLTVTLHNGTELVQDTDYVMEIAMQDSPNEAHRYRLSTQIEHDLIIDGVPVQPVANKNTPGESGILWIQEFFSDMTRAGLYHSSPGVLSTAFMLMRDIDYSGSLAGFTASSQPFAVPFARRVSPTYPRSTPELENTEHALPFRIVSSLVISINEIRTFASTNLLPRDDFWGPGANSNSNANDSEDGWEFGDCDYSWSHEHSYVARIPLTVLGRKQAKDINEPAPLDYLAEPDTILAPRIINGHVDAVAQSEFELALPVSLSDTSKTRGTTVPQNQSPYLGMFQSQFIDAKAGEYAGALWFEKIQDERLSRPAADLDQSEGQTVLSA